MGIGLRDIMVHVNTTVMDKTLSKSEHLIKLRGVLYEPKCGEPTCFHEWFRNRDPNSNPVKQYIQLFDDIYPTVRKTIAANLAASELSMLKWWMRTATALVEKQIPGVKEFETVFVSHCSARCDGNGFFFISRYRGASLVVRFFFYEGLQNEEQWHASMTAYNSVVGDRHLRKLVEAAISRKMSLCEFIENILWPFVERISGMDQARPG
ncbi:unnamed protein product [Nippostrongylus brasiliensis]|uniref:Leuk-A4-hydro_C domain-containing protein n=1 Tax=Nippostrongylus brasiliensis TaxID=27835 RepID=A0A0N4YEE6_NIPBR|nr:unnamed protein product [Nippostrongylus brasiliensis]